MYSLTVQQKQLVSILISFLALGLVVLLAGDSFGNPEKSSKYLGFKAHDFALVVLIFQSIFRVAEIRFRTWLIKPLSILLGIVIPLTAALTIFWVNSHVNAVFELTRLHLEGLTILLSFAGTALLINQSNIWWHTHWKKVIFLLPLLLYPLLFMVSVWPFNIFKELVKEDRLIEYLQFFVLLAGSFFSAVHARYFFKHKNWLHGFLFLGANIAFLFVAGDEISWGQRLLGIEVSEEIKQLNRQGEITIHNVPMVEWLVIYAYVFLSTAGLLSGWITKLFATLRVLRSYAADTFLFGYFLIPFVFFVQQLRVEWGIWHAWSEVSELYLYTGIVLWAILVGFKTRSIK